MISLFNPLHIVASLFYLGSIKHLGSILATLFALLGALAIRDYFGSDILLYSTIGVFFIGWLTASSYIKSAGGNDEVVIDEVAGMWLLLVLAEQFNYVFDFKLYVVAFFSFVIFDIVKPWPIASIDENVGGGLGIMLDDVVAAIYGFGCMVATLFFFAKLG